MRHCMAFIYRFSTCAALVTVAYMSLQTKARADSFDWRSVNGQNWNTSVKSQFGGTCWDYSACGALEAKYMLTRGDLSYQPNVSEQQICWETNPDMGNTNGGLGAGVLTYFTSHGVVSEAECPYQPSSPDVGIAPYWDLSTGWESRVWKSVSNSNYLTTDTNAMKSYLKTTGPLVVGCWASHDLYTSVADLKANYRAPDASGLDQEVALVGYYDDDTVPSHGYWVVKNSWDTGAADKGYFYIPYGNLEIHNDISAITGPVYYTGAMVAAVWKGGTSVWSSGGNNWSGVDQSNNSIPTYAWENKESSATFNAPGASIDVSGTVIAHGLTISSGATGYAFNGGALTITGGGITAHESVAINAPVTIGAPQTWTVDSGKDLSVGAIHTIISNLTVNTAGSVSINGPIDGGGVLNTNGATPGSITFSGSGTASFLGSGSVAVSIANSLTGGFYVSTANGLIKTWSGAISGSGGPICKLDTGTLVFPNSNSYSSATYISGGVLQADSGVGLPTASFLRLDGGVLQSNSSNPVTFTRGYGTSGSNKFQWSTAGGGFSAGAGSLTINIGGNTTPSSLTWSNTTGNYIVGTLKFGSTTSGNVTTFRNPINLNGADRTINVDDNPATAADFTVMSGIISNGTGTARLIKTGDGLLVLNGINTYNGGTSVNGGVLSAPNPSALGVMGRQINVASGATLQVGSSLNLANSAVLTNNGTFKGPLSIAGSAKAQGGGVYDAVTVASSGVFSPGNGVGAATTASGSWKNGGKYLFEINSASGDSGTNWDCWHVTDGLSIDTSLSKFTFAVSSLDSSNQPGLMANFDRTASYSWPVLTTGGGISGFNANAIQLDTSLLQNSLAGGRLYLSEGLGTGGNATTLYLNYSPVPEPSTIALLVVGLLGLLAYAGQRRS
jgi:autotransporter-associated beta strand protein